LRDARRINGPRYINICVEQINYTPVSYVASAAGSLLSLDVVLATRTGARNADNVMRQLTRSGVLPV
jgi:hypothetical protein